MTVPDEFTEWAATQTVHWQSLNAIAAWNLLLSPLESVLQAVSLYTSGGHSLGAAAEVAGVHKLALMAALRLRVDPGPLSEADRSTIAYAYAQAQRELTGSAPQATETEPLTDEELQSVIALIKEALTPGTHRPTRTEFLDAVRRQVTA